ncbi:MAG: hypothetical protein CW716_10170 [Candidatus Bathyarchaeum sp.]|nr:MAG: hypothetical protein CW716_10170 [Candidatus Bathyarchaeum sp.]
MQEKKSVIFTNKYQKDKEKTGNFQQSQTKTGHRLANFISLFLAPPTMAIVAIISFSLWSPIGLGFLSAPYSMLLCFLCFVLFPFFSVLYFYRRKNLDLYISKREARTPFYLVAITSYSFATLLFWATNTRIMFLLALGSLIVSISLMGVNLFWKVSIHCAGVSGPIFALICVFGINAVPLTSIVGLVGWSRLKLRNHTFAQTLAGTLISLTIVPVVFSLLYI